ncbi:MAG: ABC transporter substrate-binding protein [Chromatiales bacterium]|nr:ABC transporter substrate-binding protein [Chromatiales bacterium]
MQMLHDTIKHSALIILLLLSACSGEVWNKPYQSSIDNTLYSSFTERPKHLDPARAYSSNEYAILGQIYEPVLQYHYLKRPYQLVPLTASAMPDLYYLDAQGNISDEAQASYIVYEVEIKPAILFQPHPAFATDAEGYLYHNISEQQAAEIKRLADFDDWATRELTASDYVYQIKRLADPVLHSPIASILGQYIVGFSEFSERIADLRRAEDAKAWLDLRNEEMAGLEVIDNYRYRITVSSDYPQFIYWLAMPFFSAMPWEAERFYNQPLLQERNIVLDWFPVGSGAFMMTENNPNLRMILERNPNFRDDYYPSEGDFGDQANNLLQDANKRLPFLDKVVYSLEKESIPYWNKFLQGYYDSSGISTDSFDQAIQIGQQGELDLTDYMSAKGIELSVSYQLSTIYIGFNMLDPTIGGNGERARKLRRAISIAIDIEEYISIFLNERGLPAQSPLPLGIFGSREGAAGVNPYVYDWVNGQAQRKSLAEAKQLLADAGYEDGIDQQTQKPLIIHFDSVGVGPDAKAWLNWLRKQFDNLGVQLVIRNTDYNRFQDKMRKGTAQLFRWGWNADYPDPENFLFLFYGPNAKVGNQGTNSANYQNPQFDEMFDRMRSMPNGDERQALLDEMIALLRYDAPWIWGFHPKSFALYHQWLGNVKPNQLAHNNLKYYSIDSELRVQKQQQWNQPLLGPIVIFILLLFVFIIPAIYVHKKRQQAPAL